MNELTTTAAPAAIGPYAQGVRAGHTVYVSGQLGIDPGTGILATTDTDQLTQALRNAEAARAMGRAIGEGGHTLVFGGGKIGLMGIVADTVQAYGGRTFGVMPRFLVDREQAHAGLDELVIVDTMHERKARMIAEADVFVALPGGVGTLEEIIEVLSWRHLGLIEGPVFMHNVAGCYDGMRRLLDDLIAAGFFPAAEREMLQVCRTTEEIASRW